MFTKSSTVKELAENEAACSVIDKYFPGCSTSPSLKLAYSMKFEDMAQFFDDVPSEETMAQLDADLRAIAEEDDDE